MYIAISKMCPSSEKLSAETLSDLKQHSPTQRNMSQNCNVFTLVRWVTCALESWLNLGSSWRKPFCIDVIKHFSTLYAFLQYILSHQCTAKLRNQATLMLQIAHPPEFMILWSISERPSHPVGSNLQIAEIPLPLGLRKLFFSVGKNIG